MITSDLAHVSKVSLSTLAKIPFSFQVGHFTAKTIGTMSELNQAFALRAQVFQIEMIGKTNFEGVDTDSFDLAADHLAIIDHQTGLMVATCRLSCSLFTNRFYFEQEFQCQELMARPEIKLELGRVCIHLDFRKGAILLML
jgi:putative hemolysin